jgi:hypothetical protein
VCVYVCEGVGQLVVNVVNAHSSRLSRSGMTSSREIFPLAEGRPHLKKKEILEN